MTRIRNIGLRDVVGVITAVLLIIVFIQPSTVNSPALQEIVSGVEMIYITGAVGFMLLVVFALRVHTFGVGVRGVIVERDPEVAARVDAPVGGCGVEQEYEAVMRFMESDDEDAKMKHLAMYGNKALLNEDMPEEVEELFTVLKQTVGSVYGVTEDCGTEEALEVVERGEWCENRRANAFLGVDETGVAEFTVRERLRAWLNPKKVFESRIREVMGELEDLSAECMTYEKPNYKTGR